MPDTRPVRPGAPALRRLLPRAAAILALVAAAAAAVRGVGQTYVSLLESARGEARHGAGGAAGLSHRSGSLPPGLGGDADFAYLRGDALLARHSPGRDATDSVDPGVEALAEFRRALRLRPNWGRGWARLAYAKAVVGERDAELFESLARAVRFAPHEPEVQAMVAWTGLSQWDHLPQSTKQLIWPLVTADRVDPRTRSDILRWSVEFGLSEYLVPHLDEGDLQRLEAFRRQRAVREARRQQQRIP